MRYLLKFGYDGSKFHGFQRQKNVKNVQGELENALSAVFQKNISIKGSGRTDAGVHALMQCAHFDYDGSISKDDIIRINEYLNKDILVYKCIRVSNTFHARHNVKKKTYIYKISNGVYKEEYEGYYYQVKYFLDLKKMKKASKLFVGYHDFHNFVSGFREDYTTYIYSVNIKKKKDIIEIKFIGTGFYRYMVRHLVGALLDVGKGRVNDGLIDDMLHDSTLERRLSVAPAEGLYLVKIKY